MPIYTYEVLNVEGTAVEFLEVEQPMGAEPLTRHPRTGAVVRKVLTMPHLATRYTPGMTRDRLETKNVEKAGFTKYERDKLTGRYHKTAGLDPQAPAIIDP